MFQSQATLPIGARVVYRPFSGAPLEAGTVTGYGRNHVFVLYDGQKTAKATWPGDLRLEVP